MNAHPSPDIFTLLQSVPLYHITVLDVNASRCTWYIEVVDTNGGEESPCGANFLFQQVVQAFDHSINKQYSTLWNQNIATGEAFQQRALESKLRHTLAEWVRLVIPQQYACSAGLCQRLAVYHPDVSEVVKAMNTDILSFGPTPQSGGSAGFFWIFNQDRERIKNLAAEWVTDIKRTDYGHTTLLDTPTYPGKSGGWCYAWAQVEFTALSPHLLHHLIPGANWDTTLWEFA